MNRKRKQKYVDSHVQGALLRRIIMHWCVFFFVTAMAVVLMQTLLGDPELSWGDRIRHQLGEFTLIGAVLLSLFPIFILDTVRFSNRFVGPIGRLRRHLRDLGQDGVTDPCTFRDDDFWAGMASEFNTAAELVDSQKSEIERLKNQLAQSGITSRS